MNNKELITRISNETGVTPIKVKDVLEGLTSVLYKELSAGNSVNIDRLGTFEPGKRKGRFSGTDYIPAKITPQFKASKLFRSFLENIK